MPYSSGKGKLETLQWFINNQHQITRVLDIGVGSGTYHNLISPYLPNLDWTGVEVWEPYIHQFELRKKYKEIINQDIRKINWLFHKPFSVALAGDVLEHITKDEAIKVVEDILNIAKGLIISIPIIHFPQGEYAGNPHEIHVKDDWSNEEVYETWGKYIKMHWAEQGSEVGVYWLQKDTQ